jgi:uncharacterized membrane protein YphA (DoxX/SURF4 family)
MLRTPQPAPVDTLHAPPSARAVPAEETTTPLRWHAAKRIAFRFAFAYLVLYNLPFPLDALPGLAEIVYETYTGLWNLVVPWVGRNVLFLSYEITVLPNGSGDTTFNYVQVFCFLVVAAVATIVWTALNRNRLEYERLHTWLRVYVRFALATAMIQYGAAKVFQSQFPSLTYDRLVQPIGDASPMGILWTFMGASAGYTTFAGAVETLGGLLLVFRRTTTLGALVSAGAMTNVVLLNFCYDVPVKLYSSHLLLQCGFLLLPEMKRLADFFVFNRGTEPVAHRPLFERPWLRRGAAAAGVAFALYMASFNLYGSYQDEVSWAARTEAPRYGIWLVEEFELDGEARPPIGGDASRWRRVVFDFPGMLGVQLMSDARQRYLVEMDEDAKTIALGKRDDPDWKADFSFEEPETDVMTWHGTLDGHGIRARMRRVESPEFRLTSRGFNWINEYPFNR